VPCLCISLDGSGVFTEHVFELARALSWSRPEQFFKEMGDGEKFSESVVITG